jgi:hypothetical protein
VTVNCSNVAKTRRIKNISADIFVQENNSKILLVTFGEGVSDDDD